MLLKTTVDPSQVSMSVAVAVADENSTKFHADNNWERMKENYTLCSTAGLCLTIRPFLNLRAVGYLPPCIDVQYSAASMPVYGISESELANKN